MKEEELLKITQAVEKSIGIYVNGKIDRLHEKIDARHEKIDKRNAEQDNQLKEIKEKTDTIYGAVSWLGTTGRMIKYTAGLFTAIATVVGLGWACIKFIILEAVK